MMTLTTDPWLRPVQLAPLFLLLITVFLPLVYSSGTLSVSVWQLFSIILIPFVLIKSRLARDSGALFWISIGILFAIGLLQPLFAAERELVFRMWVLYISQLFVFAIFAIGYKKDELFWIFSRFAIIAASAIAVIMVIQFLTSSTFLNPRSYFGISNPASTWTFHGNEFVRPLGTLDNPNISGAFLLVSLPFQFYVYSLHRSRSLYFSIFVSFVAIFMTLSRGVIIGIVVLMASYFFLRYIRLLKALLVTRTGAVSVLIFAPAFAVLVFQGGVWDLVLSRFDRTFSDPSEGEYISRISSEFRFLMNWIGIKAGIEYPLFGVGLGGSAYILSDYTTLIPSWWQHRIHAFVPVLFAEAGAVSGMIWLTLQLTALYRSLQFVRDGGGAYARAIFSANAVTLYLSWFYMTLYTQEFGPIYFLILLLGIKSRCLRHFNALPPGMNCAK